MNLELNFTAAGDETKCERRTNEASGHLASPSRNNCRAASKSARQNQEFTAPATVFRLAAAAAKSVFLAADFTEWNKSPLKMVKDPHGVWQLKVNLAPGRYRYKFLIDLGHQNDPRFRRTLPFGTLQGVVDVRD